MRVSIRKIKEKEQEQVIVECVETTREIEDICAYVRSKGTELYGMDQGRLSRFCLEDVYYFEALDERAFAYTRGAVYELKSRLYELEQAYGKYHFVRCSRSVVLNLMLLEGISPALNGRFFAHMKNGERLMITRSYVPGLKRAVMGGTADE